MIWVLLIAHTVVVFGLVAIGTLGNRERRLGRSVVFAAAGSAPALAAAWSLWRLAGDHASTSSRVVWVEGLGLDLAFRVDELSALLGAIVSGVGTVVFVYSSGYFRADDPTLPRFSATLLAFSGAMLGLVWADSVWTFFLFWELTSITSYLLVAHKHADAAARTDARRALAITAAGGLALLAGLLVLVDGAAPTSLRELPPVSGASGTVAAVLVLVAAATKSAQFPFHVWLPGAMSAPTPVSAYLHSATMVKAGVIAVLVLSPALAGTAVWTPLGVGVGVSSMVWGAVGALRHRDAKLILAWGTISQLGLMIALLSVGSAKATFAAVSILVAHAVFKAALFMVVGEVDVRTGTRDVARLSGLWRSMPVAFVVAVVSAASMAGIPPLLGFAAKEAAVEAVLGLDGVTRWVMLVGVVGGSVLTVAYSVRFVVCVFGGRGTVVADRRAGLVAPVSELRPAMTVAAGVLGVSSVIGFVALGTVSDVVRRATAVVDDGARVYSLLRWPGLSAAFLISVAIVITGSVLGVVAARGDRTAPTALGADSVDRLLDGTVRVARMVAGRVQHGSLPVYLITMTVAASVAAAPFALDLDHVQWRMWHEPLEPALGLGIVACALAMLRVSERLGAALALGGVGFGVAGLFVVYGAPDLALTQLLVETIIVVGFVFGLGRLAPHFPDVGAAWKRARITTAVVIGASVSVALAVSGGSGQRSPEVSEFVRASVADGGGSNVVNVILTDIRALDTFGEILVLVVVAIGVAALAGRGGSGTTLRGGASDAGIVATGADRGEVPT